MAEENEGALEQISQDERIMAALAHAGIIMPGWGLIGAILIWATQREKSRFAAFQGLQAFVYQLSLFALGILGVGCYIGSFTIPYFLTFFTAKTIESPSEGNNPISFLLAILSFGLPLLMMCIFLLIAAAFIVYGLYGAARVLQGTDFHYPIIGRWLKRNLLQR